MPADATVDPNAGTSDRSAGKPQTDAGPAVRIGADRRPSVPARRQAGMMRRRGARWCGANRAS
jgi:hypothetical protein